MDLLVRAAVFLAGLSLTLWTINSALRSFVLPRAERSLITLMTMRIIYYIMVKQFTKNTSFDRRDRVLAMHPPISMFVLPIVWLVLITIGYTGMYWALSDFLSWREAFVLSGSSLMTLGFSFQDELIIIILAFTQAALSMMLIALMIGYLPTMYSAFTEREFRVTELEALAGSPPSAVEFIRRLAYVQLLEDPAFMRTVWRDWQEWFVNLEEHHTSLAPLNFYRSSKPDRHWVTAAGTVLDAAAIIASSLDIPRATQAGLCIRAGFVSLRTIADFFQLEYNPDPSHKDPISVTREELDAALDALEEFGLPVHQDRDECWDHFAGWRVNYDEVLIQLAWITTAPYAEWSSDRAREWREEDIPPTPASVLDVIRARGEDLPKQEETP